MFNIACTTSKSELISHIQNENLSLECFSAFAQIYVICCKEDLIVRMMNIVIVTVEKCPFLRKDVYLRIFLELLTFSPFYMYNRLDMYSRRIVPLS